MFFMNPEVNEQLYLSFEIMFLSPVFSRLVNVRRV